MPMWRCPHCGTPQPESDRCWVCRRSSTCCGTCRHYRRAVAAGLGYCGLDRRRQPLTGHETRACWAAPGSGMSPGPAAGATSEAPSGPASSTPATRTGVRNRREFEPVALASAPVAAAPVKGGHAEAPGGTPSGPQAGWSLFPELDP